MARTLIEIDARALTGMADALSKLDAQTFGQGNLNAVNDVAVRSEEKFRNAITSTINLSDEYVRGRMGVRPGDDPAQPQAVIYATFKQTQLGRYDPVQLTRPVKHPSRSKGDPLRGIPAGQKAAGVSVEVVRGSRKPIGNAFLLPLTGGGMGVFTRAAHSLKYLGRLGPAVYQLARVQFREFHDEVAIDLQLAVTAEAERIMEEVFQ